MHNSTKNTKPFARKPKSSSQVISDETSVMFWSNNLAFMSEENTASYKSSIRSSDDVFQTSGFTTRKNDFLSNKPMTAEEERLRNELAREIERELEREIMEGIMGLVRRLSDLKAKQIISRGLVIKDGIVNLHHPIDQLWDGDFLFNDEFRDQHRKTMGYVRYDGLDCLGEAKVMPESAIPRGGTGRYYGRKHSSKYSGAESSTHNIRYKRREYLSSRR